MQKVAVIGAGITGITTAYQLFKQGYEVTVIDRQHYAAMDTSYANGGQLSASNAEVWNSPANVIKALRWMTEKDAPLLVRPWPSWHKASWFVEFLANIPRHDENTVKTAKLAIASRGVLNNIAADAGFDYDRRDEGIVHFYTTQAELDHARETNRLYNQAGLERIELDRDAVRAHVPQLHADVLGGYFTPSDSTGDAHKFAYKLAAWLETQGVEFVYDAWVDCVEPCAVGVLVFTDANTSFKFDKVVISAGTGSRRLAARLGDRVNIYPVKGYSITIHLDEESQQAAPTTSLLDDHAKIVTSRLGNRFRVAGTAEFGGYDRNIRHDRVKPLLEWVHTYFPDVNTENFSPWTGLRPMMPDMMPRVQPSRAPGVYYNTGHGHLGWTLSGITSQMTAKMICNSS